MTTLSLSNLPQNIVTAESLGVYSLALLYDLYGGTKYQELPGEELTSLVSCMVGKAYDGTTRAIYRASFKINPEWSTSTNKMWDDVLPFADAQIPARYLA